MTQSMYLAIPMKIPTKTHQQKSIKVIKGKPIVYEDAELKAVRMKYTTYLAKDIPPTPFQPPIKLKLVWHYHTDNPERHGMYKITKPDVGNDFKLLLDVMQDLGFWKDDAHIAVIHNVKMWTSGKGGIEIWISEI